jgi:acetoacetate decarboxylase
MFTKGWTKNADEIRTIEQRLRAPVFADARWLSVQYLTRPEIVREVLPPPLEPATEPLVTVGIGTLGSSNCVGAFDGGMLCVRARYKAVEADYCLSMPMTTDVAIIFGRELYGEPKKQARVEFKSDGDVIRTSVERFGIRYMSLEARLTDSVPINGPMYADRFHFKFMHAANGVGLEFDPILVHVHFTQHMRVLRRGQGKVTFRPSDQDPVSEIEVVKLCGATYFEGDIHAEARRLVATVEAARFMPYAFQNIDNYSAIK